MGPTHSSLEDCWVASSRKHLVKSANRGEAEARAPRIRGDRDRDRIKGFNEAEARAPRILPAYKPLRIKAISARFRAMSHSVRQKTGGASGKILTMSKSDTQYNRLHRFERRQSFR